MSSLCAGQQTPGQGETEFARLQRLARQDREHAAAIYGPWRHPYNVHLNDEPPRRLPDAAVVPIALAEPACVSHAGYCVTCRQATADPAHGEPPMPSPFKGRPGMAIADRAWLRCRRNRLVVRRLWDRLEASPRSVLGGYGNLDDEAMVDEDGLRESIVSHWRSIDYLDDGRRVVIVPGSHVARDLMTLGLSREAIALDAVDERQLRCERCSRSSQATRQQDRRPAERWRSTPPKPAATGKKIVSVFVREGSHDR